MGLTTRQYAVWRTATLIASAHIASAWTPFSSPTVPGYQLLPKSDVPFSSLRNVCGSHNAHHQTSHHTTTATTTKQTATADIPPPPPSLLSSSPSPLSSNCTVADIAAACNADPACSAFNTEGSLKSRADCGWGSVHCVFPQGQPYADADTVDLYIKHGADPPAEWRDSILDGSMLYVR